VQDSRVSSLLPAEYGKNSALFMNLSMAISNICKNVKT
jgi:hypothetical protein